MTVKSLMQMCEGLGIKLTLAGDDHNRLQVDAPKGTLTQAIREELTTHKLDLVVALVEQSRAQTQAQTIEATNSSDDSVTHVPSPRRTISDQQLSAVPTGFERADAEVNNLLAGRKYDV